MQSSARIESLENVRRLYIPPSGFQGGSEIIRKALKTNIAVSIDFPIDTRRRQPLPRDTLFAYDSRRQDL
jgi:hypothetical protein